MAYHYVSARCDIHGFLGIADYLGITLYVEFGWAFLPLMTVMTLLPLY